jgi:hypothetical protein
MHTSDTTTKEQEMNMSSRPAIRVLTTRGVEMLGGLSDPEASTVGRHWNAVRSYLEYGYETDLEDFHGVIVAGRVLETDPDVIDWHALRGDVRFESIYDEVV